jgi:hypothetical protein
MLPKYSLRRPFEGGTKSHRLIEQSGVISKLEKRAHLLYLTTKSVWTQPLGELGSQILKVLHGHVIEKSVFPEESEDGFARREIIAECSRLDLTGVALLLLRSQKPITQIAKGQSIGRSPRNAARVEVVALIKVLLQGGICILPRAEIVQLPANLLSPPAGRMRE